MKKLKLEVFLVIAGILLLIVSGCAKAAFEIDGMLISISQADFLKKRPAAKLLSSEQDKTQTYLYFPKNYAMSGFTGTVLGRIFVNGKGCAATIAFENFSPNQRDALIRAIQLRHPNKTGERKFESSNDTQLYFEGSDIYAVVNVEEKSDIEPKPLGYIVSLKSCGSDFARKIQVLPR